MDKVRFALEYKIMKEMFPAAILLKNKYNEPVGWKYNIRLYGNTFVVKLRYPYNYPTIPPDIIIADPELIKEGCPHLLDKNRICWIYPYEEKSRRNKWNPSKDTATTALLAAHRWFLCYMVWEAKRKECDVECRECRKICDKWPIPDAEEDYNA